MVNIPADLRYSKDHEWARKENDMVRVGITDYAQLMMTDIVYVELPKLGTEIAAHEVLGVIESVKSTNDIFSPVSGVVTEVNKELETAPELMNKDPYGKGWYAVLRATNLSELDMLMTHEQYKELIEKLQGS